jgi:hypothetical protein
MVAQPKRITKSPTVILSRRFGLATALLALLGWGSLGSPALAWVKVDPPKSVNAALVYGMKSQRLSLSNLLGDNWIEGENGSLLNVYSPFMMLATKAAKAGLPLKPAKSDLEKARTRFARDVMYYSDTKNRFLVKFAVSFYGNNPDFAKNYSARIVGFGRGKDFNLKPEKQHLDQVADAITGGQSGGEYEAINSYYFVFSELADLDEFTLKLESPSAPPLEFRMKSERLY